MRSTPSRARWPRLVARWGVRGLWAILFGSALATLLAADTTEDVLIALVEAFASRLALPQSIALASLGIVLGLLTVILNPNTALHLHRHE